MASREPFASLRFPSFVIHAHWTLPRLGGVEQVVAMLGRNVRSQC